METIPIQSLSPESSPPADKAIRAVVTLIWPYSSSTKQCALLLADPDFRKRSKQGQVRVRFAGASAEAVAKAKLGIHDELVLELRGSSWVGHADSAKISTPGRSVDGELVFKTELGLRVLNKPSGEDSDTRIQVNETTPPPDEPDVDAMQHQRSPLATPARPLPSYLRNSMSGVDLIPIYSSPAFVKRQRLSAEQNSWDPFKDGDEELDTEDQPRKKQRISFGRVGRWKMIERSPSPEKEAAPIPMEVDAQQPTLASSEHEATPEFDQQALADAEKAAEATKQAMSIAAQHQDESRWPPPPKVIDFQHLAGNMPPPVLPRLHMPSTENERDGPSTPKLHPVPSSALPLPSPFPIEASQLQFGSTDVNATFVAPTPQQQPVVEVQNSVEVDGMKGASPGFRETQQLEQPSTQESTNTLTANVASNSATAGSQRESQTNNVPRQDAFSQESLSDTEPDEDNALYFQHLRERFPTFDERGYIRADHQHEDHDDDLSDVHESEVEEVIEDMGVEPEEDRDSGEEADEEDGGESEAEAEVLVIDATPQTSQRQAEKSIGKDSTVATDSTSASMPVPRTMADERMQASKQALSRSVAEGEQSQASTAVIPETPALPAKTALRPQDKAVTTPAGPPPGLFGFGNTVGTPVAGAPTPQSERDRIMKRTYSSLFGFKPSPSPEKERVKPESQALLEPASPSPAVRHPATSTVQAEGANRGDEPPALAGLADTENQPDVHQDEIQKSRATHSEFGDELHLHADQALAETTRSADVADVQDGSLLEAVRADEVEHERLGAHVAGDTVAPSLETEPSQSNRPSQQDLDSAVAQVDLLAPADQDAASEPPHVDDEPVPDGVAMNQELGEAIAPVQTQASLAQSSSAPRPSQNVEVIDLGSSDGESEDNEAQQSLSPRAVEPTRPPPLEPQTVDPLDDFMEDIEPDFPQPNFDFLRPGPADPDIPPTEPAESRHSQASGLQSEMLDTTQTTLDRSEVGTPPSYGRDRLIPDALQEDNLWMQPGHHSFLADHIQAHEFQATQLPLTQNPLDVSFQSATSVATDNSDAMAHTARRLWAREESVEVRATGRETGEDLRPVVESPLRGAAPSTAIELSSSSPAGLAAEPSLIQLEAQACIDQMLEDVMDHDRSESQLTAIRHLSPSEGAAEAFSPAQEFSQYAQRPYAPAFNSDDQQVEHSKTADDSSAENANHESMTDTPTVDDGAVSLSKHNTERVGGPETLQDNPEHHSSHTSVEQPSYPDLPISPDESQHRIESQPFETQLPHSIFPPTPQLTQGDSLIEETPAVVVEPAAEEPHETEHALRKRSRKSQVVAEEKTPVRRSARKSQASNREPTESADELEILAEQREDAPSAPAQSTRSKAPAADQYVLATPKKPAVRRSPRKPQTDSHAIVEEVNETSLDKEDLDELADEETTTIEPPRKSSKVATENSLLSVTKKTPVRRSPRKSQAGSQITEEAPEGMPDATHIHSPTEQTAVRKSTRKAKPQAPINQHDSQMAEVDDLPQQKAAVKQSEVLEEDDTEMAEVEDVPPEKSTARKSAVASKEGESETAEPPTSPLRKPATRKSLASRLGNVPDVISNWFSPRRSKLQDAAAIPSKASNEVGSEARSLKRAPSSGLTTNLSYYLPLSNLEQKLNPASQSNSDIEVLAVVTDETKAPERSKGGPRDYFTVFKITDQSLEQGDSVVVEVFRPWHAVLPVAQVGDVVLLRGFAVKSRKRRPYLISTDQSAWCVWRYATEEEAPALRTSPRGKGKAREAVEKPVWAQRATRQRASSFSGVREEIKGPPVELGEGERRRAGELRSWWESVSAEGEAEVEGPDPAGAARTRSGKH